MKLSRYSRLLTSGLTLCLAAISTNAMADTATQYFPHAVVGDTWVSNFTSINTRFPGSGVSPYASTSTVTASAGGMVTTHHASTATWDTPSDTTQQIDATGSWVITSTRFTGTYTVLPPTFLVGTSFNIGGAGILNSTIVAVNVTRTVPAGTFTDCIQINNQTGTNTTTYYSPTAGTSVESISVFPPGDYIETTQLQSYTYAPPITVVTTGVTAGLITAPIATVTATISVNPASVGKTGSVFVTALLPASFLGTSAAKQSNARDAHAMAATDQKVLAQLTQSGWQAVTNGQTIPYATGVLSAQLAAITILNKTSTANLGGSQFCVGYGTSVTDMSTNGRFKVIGAVPDPSGASASTESCLLISDARVFTFAQANYSSIFTGTGTPGKYQQYDYRYYPTYKNYLAVDDLGAVWIMGPAFNPANAPIRVGQVESFRTPITVWEAK